MLKFANSARFVRARRKTRGNATDSPIAQRDSRRIGLFFGGIDKKQDASCEHSSPQNSCGRLHLSSQTHVLRTISRISTKHLSFSKAVAVARYQPCEEKCTRQRRRRLEMALRPVRTSGRRMRMQRLCGGGGDVDNGPNRVCIGRDKTKFDSHSPSSLNTLAFTVK